MHVLTQTHMQTQRRTFIHNWSQDSQDVTSVDVCARSSTNRVQGSIDTSQATGSGRPQGDRVYAEHSDRPTDKYIVFFFCLYRVLSDFHTVDDSCLSTWSLVIVEARARKRRCCTTSLNPVDPTTSLNLSAARLVSASSSTASITLP